MRTYILHYIIVLCIFLAIDGVWLSTAGRSLYVSEIGSLLRDRPNFLVALLFYALFALALLVFVIEPALASTSLVRAIAMGAFFGLACYATYDLTNLATIKGFTPRIAVIDMVWGAVVSGAVTALSVWVVRALKLA